MNGTTRLESSGPIATQTKSEDLERPRISKWLGVMDLVGVFASIQLVIWSSDSMFRTVALTVSLIFLARCFLLYSRVEFQSRRANQKPPYQIHRWQGLHIVVCSLAAALLLGGIGYLSDIWTPYQLQAVQRSGYDWIAIKVPTVLFQQLVFQLILIPSILVITGNQKWTLILSAVAFGLFHFPNPLLVVLTTLVGLTWFTFCLERQRIVPILISHLILAVSVATVLDDYVLDMRVGPVCFQKWPTQIRSESGQILTVYPRLLTGELKKVDLVDGQVTLIGEAFDPHQQDSPYEVILAVSKPNPPQASELPSNSSATKEIEFKEIEFQDREYQAWVRTQPDRRGKFILQIDARKIPRECEVRLFARHRIGWTYPINGSISLVLPENDELKETLALHPLEFRGNIGHIKRRKNRVDIVGWGYSKKTLSPLKQLYSTRKGSAHELSFQRRKRAEIAKLYQANSLIDCGFYSSIPLPELEQLDIQNGFYVRNSAGTLEYLPMRDANGKRIEVAPEIVQISSRGPVKANRR